MVTATPGGGEGSAAITADLDLENPPSEPSFSGHALSAIVDEMRAGLADMPSDVVASVSRIVIVEGGALSATVGGHQTETLERTYGQATLGGTIYVNVARHLEAGPAFYEELRRTVQHEATHTFQARLEGIPRSYDSWLGGGDLLFELPLAAEWESLVRRACTTSEDYYGRNAASDEEAHARGAVRLYSTRNVLEDIATTVEDVLAGGEGALAALATESGAPLMREKLRFLLRYGFICDAQLPTALGSSDLPLRCANVRLDVSTSAGGGGSDVMPLELWTSDCNAIEREDGWEVDCGFNVQVRGSSSVVGLRATYAPTERLESFDPKDLAGSYPIEDEESSTSLSVAWSSLGSETGERPIRYDVHPFMCTEHASSLQCVEQRDVVLPCTITIDSVADGELISDFTFTTLTRHPITGSVYCELEAEDSVWLDGSEPTDWHFQSVVTGRFSGEIAVSRAFQIGGA